jgi:two-component system sensor histidine kinase YesM
MLAAFISLVSFSVVGMAAFNYTVLSASVRRTAVDNVGQVVGQLKGVVENYISYMEDIARLVAWNPDVQAYLASSPPDASRRTQEEGVRDLLLSIGRSRRDIDSIFLVTPDSIISDRVSDLFRPAALAAPSQLSLDVAKPRDVESVAEELSSSHVRNFIKGEYPWVVTLTSPLELSSTGKTKGTLLVDLNYRIIEELCGRIRLGKRGYVFIVNRAGEIVYHPRLRLVYSKLKTELIDQLVAMGEGQLAAKVDGEGILYVATTSHYTGWTIVGVSYDNELYAPISRLEYWYALFGLLCLLVSALVSYAVAEKITRPIQVLRQRMQEVERGNFEVRIEVDCDNEVAELAADCDIAVRKVNELMDQIRVEHDVAKREELRALQAQINPHFLYNTLDSVVWLVESGENEAAVDMVTTLAKFFRLSLARGMDVIPVRDEAEHLNCYLAIQKMRYKSKMDFRVEMEGDILDFLIPKLTLQPIAENAIYHGLKAKKGCGLLQVRGFRDGEDLVFTVSDDGVGMDAEGLLRLATKEGSSHGGVGIKNVADRLRLYFGPSYGLSYESEVERGTTVTVRIPARKEG